MHLSPSDELHLFSKELQRHMSPHALDQLARKVGYVQRKSKYRVQDLVALCGVVPHAHQLKYFITPQNEKNELISQRNYL